LVEKAARKLGGVKEALLKVWNWRS
jgi:hypothetical protein